MRKDEIIGRLALDENGYIVKYNIDHDKMPLAPLQYQYEQQWIKKWWEERSIPIRQGRVMDLLKKQGYSLPTEYLAKNLGLSLTDYYWINPIDKELSWKDINLFDNDFKENLIIGEINKNTDDNIPHYSPNASLQGHIEKTWSIIDGERCLIKGNRNNLSAESINELIACRIHRALGYDNYTQYYPIHIKGKEYDMGCYSKAFTSQQSEYVSAYAIYSSKKKKNNISPFNHFLNTCKSLGMDIEQLRSDMDYQIMTDFIISEYDRHLNNIGVIRDAETLEYKRIAPIFDSGGCLFVNKEKPLNDKDILKLKINGFATTELKMLEYVRNKNIIDLTKLPPASMIQDMYYYDSQMPEKDIKNISHWYEKKIEMTRLIHLGRDQLKKQYAFPETAVTHDYEKYRKAESRFAELSEEIEYAGSSEHIRNVIIGEEEKIDVTPLIKEQGKLAEKYGFELPAKNRRVLKRIMENEHSR